MTCLPVFPAQPFDSAFPFCTSTLLRPSLSPSLSPYYTYNMVHNLLQSIGVLNGFATKVSIVAPPPGHLRLLPLFYTPPPPQKKTRVSPLSFSLIPTAMSRPENTRYGVPVLHVRPFRPGHTFSAVNSLLQRKYLFPLVSLCLGSQKL